MIRVPLDLYSTSGAGPLDLEVALDDEGGRVVLVVNLEPFETLSTSRIKGRESFLSTPVGTIDLDGNASPETNRIMTLEHELEASRRQWEAAELEVGYLRDLLGRVADDVDRHLRPEEARALAAMLLHFAAEAER